MMVAVTGAGSSGKSAFAEQCLVNMGERKRIYAATMIAWDEECRARIKKHREMRKGKNFETAECPVDLDKLEVPAGSAVLLECMSNLAANEMYRADVPAEWDAGKRAEKARERIQRGLNKVRSGAEAMVVVTNEIFSDTGGYGEETEQYLRLLGDLNREIFEMADRVYEVVCGIPVPLKGADQSGNAGDGSMQMKLIVGGVHQGKTKYAATLVKKEDMETAADGISDEFEAAFTEKVILNFHEYIKRLSGGEMEEARERVKAFTGRIVKENPDAVVVACEIGCGIVPLKPLDRQWRELTGEAVQMLAGEAAFVCRVIGGIPMILKGGVQ